MDHLTPDRLLIVGLFLAALIGLWAFVQRHGKGLSQRLTGNRRLHLREALPLGPEGRALLIEAEGRMVLVVGHRRGAAQVLDLGPAPASEGAA